MKRILVIYTGGTIGMVSTPSGYAPEKAAFHDLLDRIPELHAEGMPIWGIVDMDPLLDSSNITVREWNAIGALIADHYADYDGFVVLHGTDTMAYTASALSFMLRGNSKPVILTGSQIPLCEIRNDARDNIITSLLVAASDRIHEVCLYFGGKLLRGNRAIKYSADDLIAFESPNYPALADVGIAIRYNEAVLLAPGRGEILLPTSGEHPHRRPQGVSRHPVRPLRFHHDGTAEGHRHRDLRGGQYPRPRGFPAPHHPKGLRKRYGDRCMLPVPARHRLPRSL